MTFKDRPLYPDLPTISLLAIGHEQKLPGSNWNFEEIRRIAIHGGFYVKLGGKKIPFYFRRTADKNAGALYTNADRTLEIIVTNE